MAKHPIQPIEVDEHGTHRFKANKIVRDLIDSHPTVDMNTLACGDYTDSDREQFAQLIGYSVSGASDLSYMSDEVLSAAGDMQEGVGELTARLQFQDELLSMLREKLKKPMADLFSIHPNDLNERG